MILQTRRSAPAQQTRHASTMPARQAPPPSAPRPAAPPAQQHAPAPAPQQHAMAPAPAAAPPALAQAAPQQPGMFAQSKCFSLKCLVMRAVLTFPFQWPLLLLVLQSVQLLDILLYV